jgi:hypothetical protein
MTTAFIVSNPLAGATRSKAIYRVIGTFLGAVFAVAVVPVLVDTPMILSSVLALWVGGCLTVSLLDRSARSYTLMLAGYTAAIIAFPSVNQPYAVFDTAVARVTEITLGIVAATLTTACSCRNRSPCRWARGWSAGWPMPKPGWPIACARPKAAPAPHPREQQQLAVDVVDCALMATHVPYDTSHWREATGTLRALLERMVLLLPLLSGLSDRRAAIAAVPENPDPDLDRARMAAQDWLAAGSLSDALPDLSMADSTLCQCAHRRLARPAGHQLSRASGPGRCPAGRMPSGAQSPARPRCPHSGLVAQPARGLPPASRLRPGPDGRHRGGGGGVRLLRDLDLFELGRRRGAAAMTAVFCCLFASLDNPVPMILRFGVAICLGVPMAGVYVFAILPMVHDFLAMAIVLAPAAGHCLLRGQPASGRSGHGHGHGFLRGGQHPGNLPAGFRAFHQRQHRAGAGGDSGRGFTAGLRNLGTDVAIKRLLRSLQRDLVRLSASPVAPDRHRFWPA